MRKLLLLLLLLTPVMVHAQSGSGVASAIYKTTFAGLPAPTAGRVRYVTDGTAGAPCTGGGSGALAIADGSAWNCSTLGSSGITNAAGNNVIPKSNGTNLVASRITDDGTNITADAGSGTFYGQSLTDALVGDGVGNGSGTVVEVQDNNKKIDLYTNGGVERIKLTGSGSPGDITITTPVLTIAPLGGNNTSIAYDDAAKTLTLNADATTGTVNAVANTVHLDGNIEMVHRITTYNNAIPTDGLLLIGSTSTGAFRTGTLGVTTPITVTNGSGTVGIACATCATNGGTLTIGSGGTPILKHLSATATLNFGNLAAIGCEDLTMTVTGAAVGDTVAIGVPNASIVTNGNFFGWVSAADTVSIKFCTVISGDPASGTFRADVWQH